MKARPKRKSTKEEELGQNNTGNRRKLEKNKNQTVGNYIREVREEIAMK